jgi:hypothetical protein
MDDVVSQFLSRGTAIIAVSVVIFVFFTRRLVEIAFPSLKPLAREMDHGPMYTSRGSLLWNQVGLYALPVIAGALFGMFVKEPAIYGGTEITTTSGRIFYAMVVGWFSDFLYEVVQKTLYKSTGIALPDPTPSVPPTERN